MRRVDYLGRSVCWECGHTPALHVEGICSAIECHCGAYVPEEPPRELPPLTEDEIRAELEGVIV